MLIAASFTRPPPSNGAGRLATAAAPPAAGVAVYALPHHRRARGRRPVLPLLCQQRECHGGGVAALRGCLFPGLYDFTLLTVGCAGDGGQPISEA